MTASVATELERIGSKFTTRTITFHADPVSCAADLLVELVVHEDEGGIFSVPEIRITGDALEDTGNAIEDGALFGIRSTDTLRVLSRMLVEVADLADEKGLVPER